MGPAELDRESPPLPIGGTMTTRQLIERALIGHLAGHLKSVTRALGQ